MGRLGVGSITESSLPTLPTLPTARGAVVWRGLSTCPRVCLAGKCEPAASAGCLTPSTAREQARVGEGGRRFVPRSPTKLPESSLVRPDGDRQNRDRDAGETAHPGPSSRLQDLDHGTFAQGTWANVALLNGETLLSRT